MNKEKKTFVENLDKCYRHHEHTADITIEAWGTDMISAFENAAYGAMRVAYDPESVTPLEHTIIEIDGYDKEELLFFWINEIIGMIDIEHKFYNKFKVDELSFTEGECKLLGKIWGETIDHNKHDAETEVKAMTYADMKFIEECEKVTLWFTLDL